MSGRARVGPSRFAWHALVAAVGVSLVACTSLLGIEQGTLAEDAGADGTSPASEGGGWVDSAAQGDSAPGSDAPEDHTVAPEAAGEAGVDSTTGGADALGDSPTGTDATTETGPAADTGTAADTGAAVDTGPPPQGDAGLGKVGTLGDACSSPGATACNGNDSQVVLICSGGAWALSGAPCPSTQRCDSTVGACANVATGCSGLQPGDEFCSGSNALKCGVDLTTTSTVATCGAHQSCTASGTTATCGCTADPPCTVAGGVCASGTTLVTCSTDVQGCLFTSATTTCANGACSGSAGSASCCKNDPSCTTAGTTCTGGSTSFSCALQPNGCLAGATYSCQGSSAGNACIQVSPGDARCGCAAASDCVGCQSGFVCNAGYCGCSTTADCPTGDCCNTSQSTVLCYPIGEGCTM